MGKGVTNRDLAALLAEAGCSHAALARRVNTAAAARHGLVLAHDQASVYWWLRGRTPHDPVPQLLAHVLAQLVGRPVHGSELGFDGPVAGWTISATPEHTVRDAAAVWRYAAGCRPASPAGFSPTEAVSAGFEWLVAPPAGALSRIAESGPGVGAGDVARLHAAREDFLGMDRAHGGGYAHTWVADYLAREVSPLLGGRYTERVGRGLFPAAAALSELAGWMAFDRGDHGLAQRCLTQALALCAHTGDRAHGSSVLSNLATQALFLGHAREATGLARAAAAAAGRTATPSLRARLAVVEARGWALLGDPVRARPVIRRAEKAMDRTDPSGDPWWLSPFTAAHYAGSLMHAMRDLGQHSRAAALAGQAMDLPAGSVRAGALHQVLHGSVLAHTGDLDGAVAAASPALCAAPGLRSARLTDRLRQLNVQLAPHSTDPAVARYLDAAHVSVPGHAR